MTVLSNEFYEVFEPYTSYSHTIGNDLIFLMIKYTIIFIKNNIY